MENYWILFRDLVGIPIPAGGEAFIYWASDWTVLDEDGLGALLGGRVVDRVEQGAERAQNPGALFEQGVVACHADRNFLAQLANDGIIKIKKG